MRKISIFIALAVGLASSSAVGKQISTDLSAGEQNASVVAAKKSEYRLAKAENQSEEIQKSVVSEDPVIKDQVAREIVKYTGVENLVAEMAVRNITGILGQLQQSGQKLDKRQINIVNDTLFSTFTEATASLVRLYSESYKQAFTLDELKQIQAFYLTDAGKKIISELPNIAQKNFQAGLKWNKDTMPAVFRKIRTEFKKEGIPLKF